MIQQIKLVQIKDVYVGQVDILRPLIERIKIYGFPLEIVPVKKSLEWLFEYQCYEPLPEFAYLIAAAKLALPSPEIQTGYALQTYLVADEFDEWSRVETETLLESSRIRMLFNKGEIAVNAYCKKVRELKGEFEKLQDFSELVNNAKVE